MILIRVTILVRALTIVLMLSIRRSRHNIINLMITVTFRIMNGAVCVHHYHYWLSTA